LAEGLIIQIQIPIVEYVGMEEKSAPGGCVAFSGEVQQQQQQQMPMGRIGPLLNSILFGRPIQTQICPSNGLA
jgi:hypothetical protein